ncbi:MAG: hypothetical protein WKG32_22635 [Gemmatimonadaceae bacterium]
MTEAEGAPGDGWWRRTPALAAILLVAALAGVVLLASPPFYQTNDDVALSMIASGFGFAAWRDPHLFFSHIWLGRALVRAPSIGGVLPYDAHVMGATLAAAFIATYAVLRLARTRWHVALIALAGALTLPLPLAQPQFTVTAALLATAAILLAASLTLAPPTRMAGAAAGWLVVGAAALYGYLTRSAAFFLIALVSAPLWLLVPALRARVVSRRGIVVAMVGLLCLVGLRWADRRAYEAPAWRPWAESQALLGAFIDFENRVRYDASTRHVFDAVGWSETDYRMLVSWYFVHQATYSPAKLAAIIRSFPPAAALRANLAGVRTVPETALRPELLPLIVAVAVLWALLRGQGRWAIAACSAMATTALVGVALVGRMPLVRVYYPVFAFLVLAALLLLVRAGGERNAGARATRWMHGVALAALLACTAALWTSVRATHRARSERARLARADLERLALRPDQLLVVWGAGIPVEDIFSPLARGAPLMGGTDARRMQLFLIGFPALAPFAQGRLRERGIGEVHRALYERDDVLLAASAQEVEMLRAFILQHEGVVVEPRVYLAGRAFTVYQLRRAAGGVS